MEKRENGREKKKGWLGEQKERMRSRIKEKREKKQRIENRKMKIFIKKVQKSKRELIGNEELQVE